MTKHVPEALKLAKNLQVFHWTNGKMTQELLNQICQLDSLKEFIVSRTYGSINPEFIEQLAFSKNPIEKFKVDSCSTAMGCWDEKKTSKALRTLFEEKRNTLKHFDSLSYTFNLRRYHYGNNPMDDDHTKCLPFPNFNLCKNITKIDEDLHKYDLELISDLPKLEALRIHGKTIKDPTFLEPFHQMNLSSLKFLSLHISVDQENFFQELSKVHFPCLRRLSVKIGKDFVSLSETPIEWLANKILSLKSLHLDFELSSEDRIAPLLVFRMLKNENVIIINGTYHKKVEEFLLSEDSNIYGKYMFMKKDHYQEWGTVF